MGGLNNTLSETDKVQGSHTDTLVVLARLFSNSTPPALTRALAAYEDIDVVEKRARPERSQRRAVRLTPTQITGLVDRYNAGATVYELGEAFGVHRTTVAEHLKRAGHTLRRQPPSQATVKKMVKLYDAGFSLVNVGSQLGFDAETVRTHIKKQGTSIRKPHERKLPATPITARSRNRRNRQGTEEGRQR